MLAVVVQFVESKDPTILTGIGSELIFVRNLNVAWSHKDDFLS
jgi:hypothetical protein